MVVEAVVVVERPFAVGLGREHKVHLERVVGDGELGGDVRLTLLADHLDGADVVGVGPPVPTADDVHLIGRGQVGVPWVVVDAHGLARPGLGGVDVEHVLALPTGHLGSLRLGDAAEEVATLLALLGALLADDALLDELVVEVGGLLVALNLKDLLGAVAGAVVILAVVVVVLVATVAEDKVHDEGLLGDVDLALLPPGSLDGLDRLAVHLEAALHRGHLSLLGELPVVAAALAGDRTVLLHTRQAGGGGVVVDSDLLAGDGLRGLEVPDFAKLGLSARPADVEKVADGFLSLPPRLGPVLGVALAGFDELFDLLAGAEGIVLGLLSHLLEPGGDGGRRGSLSLLLGLLLGSDPLSLRLGGGGLLGGSLGRGSLLSGGLLGRGVVGDRLGRLCFSVVLVEYGLLDRSLRGGGAVCGGLFGNLLVGRSLLGGGEVSLVLLVRNLGGVGTEGVGVRGGENVDGGLRLGGLVFNLALDHGHLLGGLDRLDHRHGSLKGAALGDGGDLGGGGHLGGGLGLRDGVGGHLGLSLGAEDEGLVGKGVPGAKLGRGLSLVYHLEAGELSLGGAESLGLGLGDRLCPGVSRSGGFSFGGLVDISLVLVGAGGALDGLRVLHGSPGSPGGGVGGSLGLSLGALLSLLLADVLHGADVTGDEGGCLEVFDARLSLLGADVGGDEFLLLGAAEGRGEHGRLLILLGEGGGLALLNLVGLALSLGEVSGLGLGGGLRSLGVDLGGTLRLGLSLRLRLRGGSLSLGEGFSLGLGLHLGGEHLRLGGLLGRGSGGERLGLELLSSSLSGRLGSLLGLLLLHRLELLLGNLVSLRRGSFLVLLGEGLGADVLLELHDVRELLLLLEEHGHLLLLLFEVSLGRVLELEVLHLELLELKKSLILTLEPLQLLARVAHLLAVGGGVGGGRRRGGSHGRAGGGGHLARLEISDLPAHGANL